MSSMQVGHTATLLPDGKVPMAGGRSSIPPEVLTAPAEVHDRATDTFSRVGGYASPGTMYRSGGSLWPKASLLPDGLMLIIGDNPAEAYDPRAGTFSLTGGFASPEFGHGIYWHQATSLSDGRVLVTGGNDDWTCGGFARAELYDPATGSIRDVGTMTESRDIHTATLLPGAFGEGFAMLAAAGGPGTHPHEASSSQERERWDRDVKRAAADMRTIEEFLTEATSGRLTDEKLQATFFSVYGEQGPWYTVGWLMASTIERELGRPALLDAGKRGEVLLSWPSPCAGWTGRVRAL